MNPFVFISCPSHLPALRSNLGRPGRFHSLRILQVCPSSRILFQKDFCFSHTNSIQCLVKYGRPQLYLFGLSRSSIIGAHAGIRKPWRDGDSIQVMGVVSSKYPHIAIYSALGECIDVNFIVTGY